MLSDFITFFFCLQVVDDLTELAKDIPENERFISLLYDEIKIKQVALIAFIYT